MFFFGGDSPGLCGGDFLGTQNNVVLKLDSVSLTKPSLIHSKICLLVYKSLHNMAPAYLSGMFHIRQNTTYSLRSDSSNLVNLVVPRTRCKSFGDRSFSVCGPRFWNALPPSVKLSPSISVFKQRLKTYLFNSAFHEFV